MGGEVGGVGRPVNCRWPADDHGAASWIDRGLRGLSLSIIDIRCKGGGFAPSSGEEGGLRRPFVPMRLLALRRGGLAGLSGSSTSCRRGLDILTKECRYDAELRTSPGRGDGPKSVWAVMPSVEGTERELVGESNLVW